MVYEDGTVCRFPAGGPVEAELVELIVAKVERPWYWPWRSRSRTRIDVKDAILEFKKNGRIVAGLVR
jgi:hypothetical protein